MYRLSWNCFVTVYIACNSFSIGTMTRINSRKPRVDSRIMDTLKAIVLYVKVQNESCPTGVSVTDGNRCRKSRHLFRIVFVISITRHTYVVGTRIGKHANIDQLSDGCRYVKQEEDANYPLRSTPYCINTQKHQNCN